MAGYLVLGFLESALFQSRGSLTFWWLAGLMVSLGGMTRREQAEASSA
jgi:hypothetical protein